MDGCSWLFILVLGCFFLFLVGFGRFGCFGRHLLLGRVGGVVTEVKGKQHATSLATQPTSMWDHAFPKIDDDFINEFEDDNDIDYDDYDARVEQVVFAFATDVDVSKHGVLYSQA